MSGPVDVSVAASQQAGIRNSRAKAGPASTRSADNFENATNRKAPNMSGSHALLRQSDFGSAAAEDRSGTELDRLMAAPQIQGMNPPPWHLCAAGMAGNSTEHPEVSANRNEESGEDVIRQTGGESSFRPRTELTRQEAFPPQGMDGAPSATPTTKIGAKAEHKEQQGGLPGNVDVLAEARKRVGADMAPEVAAPYEQEDARVADSRPTPQVPSGSESGRGGADTAHSLHHSLNFHLTGAVGTDTKMLRAAQIAAETALPATLAASSMDRRAVNRSMPTIRQLRHEAVHHTGLIKSSLAAKLAQLGSAELAPASPGAHESPEQSGARSKTSRSPARKPDDRAINDFATSAPQQNENEGVSHMIAAGGAKSPDAMSTVAATQSSVRQANPSNLISESPEYRGASPISTREIAVLVDSEAPGNVRVNVSLREERLRVRISTASDAAHAMLALQKHELGRVLAGIQAADAPPDLAILHNEETSSPQQSWIATTGNGADQGARREPTPHGAPPEGPHRLKNESSAQADKRSAQASSRPRASGVYL